MATHKRKYTILPSVPTPDYEEILNASSDYSDPGVLEYTTPRNYTTEALEALKRSRDKANLDPEEIERLKKLGQDVSISEEKAREESRARMEAIKSRAVTGPESITTLREAASKKVIDDERREQIAKEMEQRDEENRKQEELDRARQERRAQQKRAVEELKAKAAANEAAAAAEKAAIDKARAEREAKEKKALDAQKAAEAAIKAAEAAKAAAAAAAAELDASANEDADVAAWSAKADKIKESATSNGEASAIPERAPDLEPASSDDDMNAILSDEETADSFSEFLDP